MTDTLAPPDMETRLAIAIVSDYPGLKAAMIARRKALGLSQFALDQVSGLQDGYSGKLEAGIKHYGFLSLGLTLGALGVELAVVEAATKVRNGRPGLPIDPSPPAPRQR